MPFSDDDLKRLKQHLEDLCACPDGDVDEISISDLLARLETAEQAVVELYSLTAPVTEKGMAWRKAAGK